MLGTVLLAASLSSAASPSGTGLVSMDDQETAGFGLLVSSDASARAAFEDLRRAADEGLSLAPKPLPRLSSAAPEARAQLERARALAIVYRVTKDRRYWAQAKAYLLAWAALNRPSGDPQGDAMLEPLVEAYDLLKLDIRSEDRPRLELYFRSVGEAEMAGAPRKPDPDVRQSERLMIVGLIGYAIRRDRLAKYALEGFERQIGRALKSDGSSVGFGERGDPAAQASDLVPLLRLAIVLQRSGHVAYDYRAPNGASLRRAVQFLKAFAEGGKSARPFDPKQALTALALAEFFEPRLLGLVAKLLGPRAHPPLRVLLNAATRP